MVVSNEMSDCCVCHMQIKGAEFAVKEKDGRSMHIIRLKDGGGKSLLSAILAPEEPGGAVEEGAITFWENLRERFGSQVELTNEVVE